MSDETQVPDETQAPPEDEVVDDPPDLDRYLDDAANGLIVRNVGVEGGS